MKSIIHFKPDPFSPDLTKEVEGILSIADMLRMVDAPDWFWEYGVVTLNGYMVPREMWKFITPKRDSIIRLTVVQQGDNVLPIVAGLALVALTAGIGTFGLPFLGASFAAGTVGASAVATGVGLIGSIAISQLTSAPLPKTQGNEQRQLSNAGISSNQITLHQLLPVVVGKIRFSPPVIIATYTTFENEELTVHTVVGFEGRCLIEDIQINSVAIGDFPNVTYEEREGGPGEAALTLAPLTCIQRQFSNPLSNFLTKLENATSDSLVHQDDPDSDLPDYHLFKTSGTPTEIWLRFLFPSGIIDTADNEKAVVPIRIEARKVGDVTWRKFPTVHVFDTRKGAGPFRVEVKLKFQTQPSGRHFSNATLEYPIFELTNITGIGQSFEYEADSYFQNAAVPTNINTSSEIPVMTGATTAGVTMSASSEFAAGNAAWKASDNSGATSWRPTADSLPAWIKVDFGSAKTIRSWYVEDLGAPVSTPTTTMPTEFYMEGSNDDSTWTLLDSTNIDISDFVLPRIWSQVGTPGSYRYYRLNVVSNNGAASERMEIGQLRMFTFDCPGSAVGADYSTNYGDPCRHDSGPLQARCIYGSLNRDGATFYLDPAQWLPGEYEVRVKRGVAVDEDQFNPVNYNYGGVASSSDFFEYRLSGGVYIVRVGQKNYRSDCVLEVFSTVVAGAPVETSGVCCIAVEATNLIIDTISADFTSYGHDWETADVWNEDETPTQNNATLFREVLNGYGNFTPVPGNILDDQSLIDWFAECVTQGHQVNAVFQDRSVADVLQVIAYTGMAAIKYSNLIGVVMDRDRSAEAVGHPISPMNSQFLGMILERPELPDAVYVEYADATDSYRMANPIVYRDGFNEDNARIFDTLTYEGITDEATALARAAFDLKALEVRSTVYQYKLGPDGFLYERGDLVRLSDDSVDEHRGYGFIQEITLDANISDPAANVVSITLEDVLPYGDAQGSISADDDITTVTDILDETSVMGVSISLTDGSALIKQVTNVTDSNTCVFTTPFNYVASGIELGNFVSMGVLGNEVRRCYVANVEPLSLQERIIDLKDCADEDLF